MRLRRRNPAREEALALFAPVAEAVNAAQRDLLGGVPTSRHPGAPLSTSLDAFEDALDRVAGALNVWRNHAPPKRWEECASGLEAASKEAIMLRATPPGPTDFEELNARIGDVLAHLDVFADTERSLR